MQAKSLKNIWDRIRLPTVRLQPSTLMKFHRNFPIRYYVSQQQIRYDIDKIFGNNNVKTNQN